jgi:hypothetical protein
MTMKGLLSAAVVSTVSFVLLLSGGGGNNHHSAVQALSSSPQGSAARPTMKQKVAVLGSGGYMGAMTFGFLQRASSLYGTGIGGCRCLGATAETGLRLNRILSKHFCLAMADESYIKLTDLSSVDAVCNRLEGWDALILGGPLGVTQRPVTGGTYERRPNDKTWEVYWDPPGTIVRDDADVVAEARSRKMEILKNVLAAAKKVGVKHVVALDDNEDSILPLLEASGVPYTCLQPRGELVQVPNYTFRNGVQGKLSVSKQDMSSAVGGQISKEDLAALCVQSLQSLDWTKSRCLQVSCFGPVDDDAGFKNPKRPDQEWCVNSYRLDAALSGLS